MKSKGGKKNKHINVRHCVLAAHPIHPSPIYLFDHIPIRSQSIFIPISHPRCNQPNQPADRTVSSRRPATPPESKPPSADRPSDTATPLRLIRQAPHPERSGLVWLRCTVTLVGRLRCPFPNQSLRADTELQELTWASFLDRSGSLTNSSYGGYVWLAAR